MIRWCMIWWEIESKLGFFIIFRRFFHSRSSTKAQSLDVTNKKDYFKELPEYLNKQKHEFVKAYLGTASRILEEAKKKVEYINFLSDLNFL